MPTLLRMNAKTTNSMFIAFFIFKPPVLNRCFCITAKRLTHDFNDVPFRNQLYRSIIRFLKDRINLVKSGFLVNRGNWGLTKLSVLIYIKNVPEVGVIIA